MPKNWEGNVRLRETADGSNVFTIEPHKDGQYNAENPSAILKALATHKAVLSGWKVWLDGDFDVKLDKGQDVKPAMLAKIIKQADDVQLAYVNPKKSWPQPKLRFIIGDGSGPVRKAKKASNLRVL